MIWKSFLILLLQSAVLADVSELLTTLPPPPKPYHFSYVAGRAPGHTDRIHSEASDGTGVVRGMYSYVDPRQQIRTVHYEADRNGFHATVVNPVHETAAVAAERAKHAALYGQIAAQQKANLVVVPAQSEAVRKATARHEKLYNRIAAQHAEIAAAREIEAQVQNGYVNN